MVEVCIIKGPSDFSRWWSSGSHGYELYFCVVLLFFSLVIALPMAKLCMFLLRYILNEANLHPDEANEMLLWETHLLLRVGLFCWALEVVGVTNLFCQWPLWAFGVPLLLWVNAVGNVYRLVTVRKGSAKTLLHEGMTVLKVLVLGVLFYTIYILIFPGIADNIVRAFFTGFCAIVAMATVPIFRNATGSQFILFNEGLRHAQRLHLYITSTPPGILVDAPLGYIITSCDALSKTYVPAGKALVTPLVVFEDDDDTLWPLHLKIILSPSLPVPLVRRFMQDIDNALHKFDHNDVADPHRQPLGNYFTGSLMASSKSLLQKRTAPSKRYYHFKKCTSCTLSLEDQLYTFVDGRWIIYVHGWIAAKSKEMFRDRLSQKTQIIMSIMERHSLSKASLITM
ncbi:hypothetical protein THRCLA_11289 [Thraustotheca clavata]|uniref:Transmembrane protein n=1 Tax=Thraustotheca clavata TaxID=74557 RepID=A0A1V9Y867_9STRA|nr:hypothetical protein THRCLA_11289 [Thraustotheca clavata]